MKAINTGKGSTWLEYKPVFSGRMNRLEFYPVKIVDEATLLKGNPKMVSGDKEFSDEEKELVRRGEFKLFKNLKNWDKSIKNNKNKVRQLLRKKIVFKANRQRPVANLLNKGKE